MGGRGFPQSTFIRTMIAPHLKIASQAYKLAELLSKEGILLLLMNVLNDQMHGLFKGLEEIF